MQPSTSKPHHPILGITCKLGAVVLLSLMAACVKYLGREIPSGETIFVRGIISIAVLALIAWRTEGLHLLKTKNLRSHALRSLSGTISMFGLFLALAMIPFADVTAITFTAPLFLTVLAMLFLGERIHRYRLTALMVGFAGVIIMIGPLLSFGADTFAGAMIALGAAVFSAFAMMFLRSMSGGEPAITITFYFSLTSMICAALTWFWGWPTPNALQWAVIILAGVLGVLGQLLLTLSYRYAEASTIAPLDYTAMIMAVLLGYIVFGEVPGASIWIGAPLVICAGLVIFWREYRLHKTVNAKAV